MGFIDTMLGEPQSDLYRFADPGENVRRMALEDMTATAQSAIANRQSPTGNPQSAIPTLPPERRILTSHEWVAQNYPDVRGMPIIPKTMLRQIVEGYKLYLTVQEMSMRNRLERYHAKMRGAELLERRAGRTGKAAEALRGQIAPKRENLLPGSALYQGLVSESQIDPGLVSRIAEEPVKGWLALRRFAETATGFTSEQGAGALAELVQRYQPTVEQVREAKKAGQITAEEAVEVLRIILAPEEFAAYEERARAQEKAKPPKRSFWEGLTTPGYERQP